MKLTPAQYRKLDKAVDEILMNEWDPIGVECAPEAAGEYNTYGGRIISMLVNGTTQREIEDYLWFAETDRMGLPGNRECNSRVAIMLMKLMPDP